MYPLEPKRVDKTCISFSSDGGDELERAVILDLRGGTDLLNFLAEQNP